jgi:predicted nucleotidyltransferase
MASIQVASWGCLAMDNMQEKIELNQLISMIVSTVAPEKIILFGSRARSDHRPDSDYDILVIMKHLENKNKLCSLLYWELLNIDFPHPVDFLAISCDKYEELKTRVGFVYKTIDREGKIIYEQ